MKKTLLISLAVVMFLSVVLVGFSAEYNAPATLTSLGTQAWTAAEKTQALVGSSTVDFAADTVLIATTTDDGVNKLQVNGNIRDNKASSIRGFAKLEPITLVFGVGESRTLSTFGVGENASYEIFATAPAGTNSTDGIYYALVTSEGTAISVTEIANAAFFTIDLAGSYLRITNNTGKILYTEISIRRCI